MSLSKVMGFIFDILIWIESTIRILEKIRIEAMLDLVRGYKIIYNDISLRFDYPNEFDGQ